MYFLYEISSLWLFFPLPVVTIWDLKPLLHVCIVNLPLNVIGSGMCILLYSQLCCATEHCVTP